MKKRFMAMVMVSMLAVLMPGMHVQAADAESNKAEVDIAEMLSGAKEQIAEALDQIDKEQAEEIFDFIKEKISDGSLKTEEGLDKAIEEGEEKFDITVDKATAQQVVETMEKLEEMGFSGEEMMEKAKGLYEEYGADFIEHSNEVVADVVKDAVSKSVGSFFENVRSNIKDFFRNVFKVF